MLDLREIAPETPRQLSRAEYDRLVELGWFEGERVELLDGVVVTMSPHGPEHDSALERLTEILLPQVVGRARVRVQSGFAASDGSEPEPDLAVVPVADYSKSHPTEAFLVIEVAKTSLDKDRGLKARLYASSNVPEYWVVDLVNRIVEVFFEPRGELYRRINRYVPGDMVAVQSLSQVCVAVNDVLPPA